MIAIAHRMCKDIELFAQIDQNLNRGKLNLANSAYADIEGIGTVEFETCTSDKRKAIEFGNTLFIPDLRMNLISVDKITDKEHKVFSDTKAEVIDRTDKVCCSRGNEKGDFIIFPRRQTPTAGRSPNRTT